MHFPAAKPYINEIFTYEDARLHYDACGTKAILTFLNNSNLSRKNDFLKKIQEKKASGKLKPITSLDDEVLYDLRFTYPIGYVMLAQIFETHTRIIARLYQKKKLTGFTSAERTKLFQRFGMRTIDVDKFVAHLTIEKM
jgi:hypothetical protein